MNSRSKSFEGEDWCSDHLIVKILLFIKDNYNCRFYIISVVLPHTIIGANYNRICPLAPSWHWAFARLASNDDSVMGSIYTMHNHVWFIIFFLLINQWIKLGLQSKNCTLASAAALAQIVSFSSCVMMTMIMDSKMHDMNLHEPTLS